MSNLKFYIIKVRRKIPNLYFNNILRRRMCSFNPSSRTAGRYRAHTNPSYFATEVCKDIETTRAMQRPFEILHRLSNRKGAYQVFDMLLERLVGGRRCIATRGENNRMSENRNRPSRPSMGEQTSAILHSR